MSSGIPLAWKNLTHDRRKLVVAIGGIVFAVMLMFQQRGFNDALFDSTVKIVRELDADLIIVNPLRFSLSSEIRFARSAIDEAASHPGVSQVKPLFIENIAARLRIDKHRAHPIRVLAFDLNNEIFFDRIGEIKPQLAGLSEPNTAIMDRLSMVGYGFDLSPSGKFPKIGELSGRPINIIGTFHSGRDFAHDGNLIMSQENFTNYFRYRGLDPLSIVDLGLVKLQKDADSGEVCKTLQASFGKKFTVLTRQQFIDKEIGFWSRSTPVGVIFTIGTIMGFVVGVIICYQILANDISEHMGEFATLKAMGYKNSYFFGLVICQSIYLALFGFVPGLILSWGLFYINSNMTGLLLELTMPRIALILIATLTMCIVSGLLAVRKLIAADPASLF